MTVDYCSMYGHEHLPSLFPHFGTLKSNVAVALFFFFLHQSSQMGHFSYTTHTHTVTRTHYAQTHSDRHTQKKNFF